MKTMKNVANDVMITFGYLIVSIISQQCNAALNLVICHPNIVFLKKIFDTIIMYELCIITQ